MKAVLVAIVVVVLGGLALAVLTPYVLEFFRGSGGLDAVAIAWKQDANSIDSAVNARGICTNQRALVNALRSLKLRSAPGIQSMRDQVLSAVRIAPELEGKPGCVNISDDTKLLLDELARSIKMEATAHPMKE